MSGWDVHTHLVPPTVLEAARRGAHGLAVTDGALVVDGRARLPLRRLAEPEALLDWVDEQGLDGAVVSVPPPLLRYDLSGAAAAAWAGLVDDGLLQLAGLDPARLRVLGHVPLGPGEGGAEVAALAVERLTDQGGFAGVALGTLADPPGFAAAALDRLWEVLDACGAFVLLHPAECPDPRLQQFYLSNLLGNPYETAVAVAGLVFADVVGRFPGIRFCLCHGGGVTAAVADRWQRGMDTARPGVRPTPLSVLGALRRFYVDDLVHGDAPRALVEEVFGAEQVLCGSDWPFPMGSDGIDRARAAARADLAEELTRGLRRRSGAPSR